MGRYETLWKNIKESSRQHRLNEELSEGNELEQDRVSDDVAMAYVKYLAEKTGADYNDALNALEVEYDEGEYDSDKDEVVGSNYDQVVPEYKRYGLVDADYGDGYITFMLDRKKFKNDGAILNKYPEVRDFLDEESINEVRSQELKDKAEKIWKRDIAKGDKTEGDWRKVDIAKKIARGENLVGGDKKDNLPKSYRKNKYSSSTVNDAESKYRSGRRSHSSKAGLDDSDFTTNQVNKSIDRHNAKESEDYRKARREKPSDSDRITRAVFDPDELETSPAGTVRSSWKNKQISKRNKRVRSYDSKNEEFNNFTRYYNQVNEAREISKEEQDHNKSEIEKLVKKLSERLSKVGDREEFIISVSKNDKGYNVIDISED